ncbi:unnamed protein product [Effrenium voratum]|nr:unnamed protein product [Effrenium voratum]
MEALLGPKLLHGSQEVATSSLERGVVGLYFSAHWCGPCRNYTPQFRKVYERARAAGRAFEVVFISSDHDEASFRSYFSGMPWHAVPFSDRLRQQQLSSVFKVQGIPSLILLDANGQVWNPNARGTVMQPSFLGSLPRRVDLEAQRLPQPEEAVPICVRHKGREMEIECEPGEGWEILRMQIFSLTEVPEEQMKLFGLGLDQGLLDDSVPLPVALARARAAARGSGLRLAKVPPERRRASSTHNAEKIAAQHGTLESGTAWGANKEDQTSWYQLDLGAVQDVSGVLVASRVDCPQWITRFRVALADVEEGPWAHADGGREFDGPSLLASTRAVFHCSKRARFVRIEPLSFKGHCSLRADVLLADGAEPDKPTLVVLGNFSAGDPFEITEAKPDAMVEEQHLAFLQAKLSAMPAKLQSQAGQLQMVQRYELWDLQRQALEEIPVCGIDAGIDGSESYELAFLRRMLRWYKHEFFTWTNAPRCDFCRSTDTKTIGGTEPTPEEQHFLAFKVEVAKCNACGQQTRFPRYNDPAKLLETRTGRCGEWANCFTLLCRALGYEARHVHDWTDHVWTEVFSDSEQRWIHLDSCEAAFDSPLMYEKGWGKKLTYCIGFARDHVTDVTRRYTQKFEELLTRRTACTEQDLSRTVAALSEFALDRSVSQLPAAAAEARRAQLASRGAAEQTQLAAAQSGAKAEEEVGRTSGDAAWREQRGELGANSAAKQKALACSELGVEGAAAPASKPAEPKAPASTPAAPKAPAEGHSSQEAQARMRARIAQFVAEGMTANEALLKVIQEAKMTNA